MSVLYTANGTVTSAAGFQLQFGSFYEPNAEISLALVEPGIISTKSKRIQRFGAIPAKPYLLLKGEEGFPKFAPHVGPPPLTAELASMLQNYTRFVPSIGFRQPPGGDVTSGADIKADLVYGAIAQEKLRVSYPTLQYLVSTSLACEKIILLTFRLY